MRALFAALLLCAACNHDAAPATQSAPPPAPKAAAAAFGDPLNVTTTTSLTDILKSPANYKGKTIATQGTVSKVCQERGCWMAIKDDTGTATIRMHGHSFFVPTTSSGKHARVQGTVMLTKDGKECDDMEAVGAQLEIDATGVELD
jgi:hypothetical protein